jgi:hypothetical protein
MEMFEDLHPFFPKSVFVIHVRNVEAVDLCQHLAFVEIFKILKGEDFEILEGVDSNVVPRFVSWIES